MADALTPESIATICAHMNDDHADAVAGYARTFGGLDGVRDARLIGLDRDGMDLDVGAAGGRVALRIAFPRPVGDRDEARAVLVEMARAT